MSRGRPKKEVIRNRGYRLRMTDEEHEMVNYVAEKLGMNKSDMIRSLIESKYRMLKWYDR